MTIHETLAPFKENAIAATFADETTARTAYDLLRAQGFDHVWLATTKPADGESIAPRPATVETRSTNDVADSSEGLLGTIGRFFSGEGSSLRRSLEDHGVHPADADEIDDALLPRGAVVTAFAGDRTDLAADILRTWSTHVYLPEPGSVVPIAPSGHSVFDDTGAPAGTTSTVTSRVLVDAAPVPGMPGALEQVFVERRIVAPASTNANDVAAGGLNDLL